MQFNLGRIIGRKYSKELGNPTLDSNDVETISSKSQRAIASANAFLTGLFGLKYSQINTINKNLTKVLPCQEDNVSPK